MIDRAPTGFPALRKLFRDEFPPLLRAVDPFLRNLNPILTGLSLYKTRADRRDGQRRRGDQRRAAELGGDQVHYLRAMAPFGPESLATYPEPPDDQPHQRLQPAAGTGKSLATGLPSFDTRQCSSGVTATLDPETPNRSGLQQPRRSQRRRRKAEKSDRILRTPQEVRLRRTESTAAVPAPGCSPQAPFEPIYGSGPPTIYQHTFEQGE